MNTSAIFAAIVDARCDYQCPAVQDAIDRLVAAEGFRGRAGMLEVLRGANYDALAFNSSLLSAWKSSDIALVTGHTLDWWLELADKMSAIQLSTEDHGAWHDARGRRHTEWTAIDANRYDGAPDAHSRIGSGSTEVTATVNLLMDE